MPANAKRNTVRQTSPGAYSKRPPKVSISAERVLRATAMTTANAPRFMAA